jgi:putative transcriptional regulator
MSSLAGSFLVARHVLQDANFRQTVVLLLKHGPEGAFGLVVNRPAKAEGIPFEVFSGGPCPMEGFLMLHGHADWIPADEVEELQVAPGIFLGNASCMKRVTDPEPGQELRVRVFAGYAGWGPNQLEKEIAAGAWSVAAANGSLLFDGPVHNLWDNLVPPRIPRPSMN